MANQGIILTVFIGVAVVLMVRGFLHPKNPNRSFDGGGDLGDWPQPPKKGQSQDSHPSGHHDGQLGDTGDPG